MVASDKQNGSLPPEIEDLYERGGIKIDIERFVSLEPMVNLAKEGCTRLLEKVWYFAAPADGMSFVASDNPIYYQTPEEYRDQVGTFLGPLHPLSEVTIPLRKDLLLLFSPSTNLTSEEYERLNCTSVKFDKPDTKNINKRTTLAASRHVYSCERSEALARMVGKFRGSSQRVVV